MFTGIVEIMGSVLEHETLDVSNEGGNGSSLKIGEAAAILGDCHLGDSIAVNGVCLTVTAFGEDWFKIGMAQETLDRTNLGGLKVGDPVNLERAMNSEVRFGGHMVQGHVDTIMEIVNKEQDGNSVRFTFQLRDREFINYIVHKGFVCVDGTSLTVIDVNYEDATFQIMMIAYTQTKVVTALKSLGDWCNLEVDLAGKLIARQVELNLNAQLANPNSKLQETINELIEKKLNNKA